jgi:hypothetical protein
MGRRFTVAFVGNKSDHLATGYNYNTVHIGGGLALFPNLGQVIAQFNNERRTITRCRLS